MWTSVFIYATSFKSVIHRSSLTVSKLSTLGVSQSGECSSDPSSRAPIRFTHNTITGCMFRWVYTISFSSFNWPFLPKVVILSSVSFRSMCYLVLHLLTVWSCVPTFMGSCRDLLLLTWSPWTQALNQTGRESSPRSVLSACRYSCIRNFLCLWKNFECYILDYLKSWT